jgi:hypothetical protein
MRSVYRWLAQEDAAGCRPLGGCRVKAAERWRGVTDALSVQLAEAELEVVALTAAAQTAGSQLPLAKRQRTHGPLLRWQTETAGLLG